jgi:hypothetical protein
VIDPDLRDVRGQDASIDRGVSRDWDRHPAVVDCATASQVIAVGDIHGGYERLVALLRQARVIRADRRSPTGNRWIAGDRRLVCTGDVINKGSGSLRALDLLMGLEDQAASSGGGVIVLLGNHEAEYLANPDNPAACAFRTELEAAGIQPAVSTGRHPLGAWLRNRPIAARVNDWLFAHAGQTSGRTMLQLAERFRAAVETADWRSSFLHAADSILNARRWWRRPGALDANLRALGVRHIVFGHDPSVTRGVVTPKKGGRLFAIDVGMSPAIDDSPGAVLRITRQHGDEQAESETARGERTILWRGPAAPASSDRETIEGAVMPATWDHRFADAGPRDLLSAVLPAVSTL